MEQKPITVIGAGLAGCEAAWQIASFGIPVLLKEMKPDKKTPAHTLDTFAELVCSNSLRSSQLENAAGLLKEEMRRLGSLIMACADETAVPAGGALAVDREGFAALVTQRIAEHPLIEVVQEEVTNLPETSGDSLAIVATGPLTSDLLANAIAERLGENGLYFFDAAAPIVAVDSLDMTKVFRQSRYDKGTDDYLNCPMDKDEYLAFHDALLNAETVPMKDFEPERIFEGCMPIESMAARGVDTIRYGPLKPVGLNDPRNGKEPYAVVQLRQDNAQGTQYNLVGFQTHLKWGEQKRVFGMIPGLEHAVFERYGVMHRNTFLNGPRHLQSDWSLKADPNLFFAGQMTGVEGYVESTASGLAAGVCAAMRYLGNKSPAFSGATAIGALVRHISTGSPEGYQPKNITFGMMDSMRTKARKRREKRLQLSERALEEISCTAIAIKNARENALERK